jgi:hypothetical protein
VRAPGVARLGAVSAIVLVSAAVLAPLPFAMERTTALTADGAKDALRHLRAVLDGRAGPAAFAPGGGLEGDHVPLVLTIWRDGARWRVHQIDDEPFGAAIRTLGAEIVRSRAALAAGGHRVRLALDAAIADGWVPEGGITFSLAFVEGRYGVSGESAGRRIYVPPSELIRLQRYGSFRPLPGFDPRFKIGLDARQASSAVKRQGDQIGAVGAPSRIRRFAAISVVEDDDLRPRRLLKGTVERPPLTRARIDAAVRAGARYLVRALRADGMFRYHYAPLRDKDVREQYNWPRHAGTAYSLALVGRVLGEPGFTDAAERALDRFVAQLGSGPDGSRCLEERGGCYLGSSALGLLAIAEHRIASGSGRFEPAARGVAAFIMAMQREDGFFHHDWSAKGGVDRDVMKLYASQQGVFALARYARAFGDDAALEAAERGMDHLAGPYWDHFLGTYFFGQEHWSCLAAEEMFAARPKPEYAELCLAIGDNYDKLCHAPGDTPFPEDVGGMSVTHMFTPHVGGTATAAEAMVSAVALGRATNADVGSITAQLGWTLAFLEKGQLTAHDAFWLPAPEDAVGGVAESQTVMRIRIDNVQHVISAMIRGRDFVFPGRATAAEDKAAARSYVVTFR